MNVQNLIIGAGPAGLAVAGRFRKAGLDFEILEQTNKIASKWHTHYDRLLLHTVKSLSSLPHLDFPPDYPQYIPRQQLVTYYENYAKHFDINPHFNCEVTAVLKKNGLWQIECTNQKTFEAQNVIIATGLNRIPNIPNWKGKDIFEGEILHAASYKNPLKFKGKKVLVIGMGNTGAEIALDLAEAKIDVGISVRSEIVVVPRDFLGRPIQLTAKKLAKLPFRLGDVIGALVRRITFGNIGKYGLPVSKMHPRILIQEQGRTPIIDLGTIAKIKKGEISVFKDVLEFHENTIRFADNKIEDIDSVILATGYYPAITKFLENTDSVLNYAGEPANKVAKGEQKGLYFIGYDKFTLGGILGTLKNDSALILKSIKNDSV
ncbi:flavin-containing monooxygenase [Eudoraea adriatica]|uniref:flavin-containing monooxygenase n=1 Tax=Eudoraea adriatica TaxID=446681 RepID=UPI00037E70BC|nr:NAD(P)/FAD-dependent oxidoreductase [Eudoraea adriatica]